MIHRINFLLCVVILLLLAGGAFAQDNWVLLSQGPSSTWEAKAGSFEMGLTERTNEPIGSITVRVRNKTTTRIDFERNYVRLSDCASGHGKLVTTDLTGRAKYDNDFMLNGGTVASHIAEIICEIASRRENIAPARSGT